jgi:Fe-S-cluster containining protein
MVENSSPAEPWYQHGLGFTCTRCGNCCTGAPGYVWVNDAEVQALAAYRQEAPGEFLNLYTRRVGSKRTLREKANGDCIFYEADKGCTVYPVRPRQCQTWPFWESNLRSPKAWQRTCEVCPGSGQGDLIPVEEITRRLKVIKI